MTDEITFATMRASVDKFRDMLSRSALKGDAEHSDLYINVLDDEVRVLQQSQGGVVLTYCSFYDSYFDDIELMKDVETLEGENNNSTFEYDVGAEAIIDVEKTLDYLGFASDGSDIVELTLIGYEDDRVATFLKAEGALETQVRLRGGDNDLENVPQWVTTRFSDNDVYTNPAGDEAPTVISTNVDKLFTIIEAVEKSQDSDLYPIVVSGGDFMINVGEEESSYVQGTLSAQSVEGPDVENYYHQGFPDIANIMPGRVEIQTAPGNNPASMVYRGDDGSVIRHVNGAIER